MSEKEVGTIGAAPASKGREVLESQVEEMRSRLLSMLSYNDEGRECLDRLMELKGQLDVVPAAVCVEMKDVVKEYPFGAAKILKCRGCYVYSTPASSIVIYPVYNPDLSNGGGVLFSTMSSYCSLRDAEEGGSATQEDKDGLAIFKELLALAFSFPVMLFSDDIFAGDCFRFILDRWKESLERASDKLRKETPEDIAANQEFRANMEQAYDSVAEAEKKSDKE